MLKDFLDQLLCDYNDFIVNNNIQAKFLLLKNYCYIYKEVHPHLRSDPYWNEKIIRLYINTNTSPYNYFHMSEQIIEFNILNVRFTINSQ